VEALREGLPKALALVAVGTFVLLFAHTRSALLPLKQLLMNALTVGATFGVLVWVFQEGRLEGLLRYESLGALGVAEPAVIVVLAFALSTDYGLFLLSRAREERLEGRGNTESVVWAVGKTGGVVTSAALLFCVAVGAFATSEIVFVKTLGLGAALAVLIDATVVRAPLVPSLMTLLGEANWWAPWPFAKKPWRRRRPRARIGA
jgi:RND superfamily putative drug exporter